ncbi:MAG TPA: YdeI/OmpD-associated family protein [Tepidisphaeraceae bacterium]|nr:YdeI/OmpD-associated family protein [Tepidisphaeraceae bacterium]
MAKKNDSEVPQIMAFRSAEEWERWLATNHDSSTGIWIRFFKKHTARPSVTYAEALLGALCYGWIDGQIRKYDDESWIHRFTPRRPRSIWSKRNCQFVEQLIEAGKMLPAGLKEIEAAKADGRWDKAYDSPSAMTVPDDFLKALARNKSANRFFQTLNKANVYAIAWRLQTAKKPETRQRRMEAILQMLADGKRFHEKKPKPAG